MSNHYKKKAKKKHMRGGFSGTDKAFHLQEMKGSLEEAAKNTPVDIGAAIGGGFVGSAIGKPSLVAGILVSGVSHFFKHKLGDTFSRLGSLFGVGIMAGGFAKSSQTVSGTTEKQTMEAAKERMKSYGSDLKHRLYLDKIPAAKKATTTTSTSTSKTVEGTETFYYPQTEPHLNGEMDLSALDDFQEGLQERTKSHHKREEDGEVNGMQWLDDISPTIHNY